MSRFPSHPRRLDLVSFLALALSVSALLLGLSVPVEADLPVFVSAPGTSIDVWMLLGPLEGEDEGLPALFGSPDNPAVDLNSIVWRDGSPFMWFSVETDLDGTLDIAASLPSDKQGRSVYLYRTINLSGSGERRLVLEGSSSPKAWLNGVALSLAEDSKENSFALKPPESEAHLIVRCIRPEEGEWNLRVSFDSPQVEKPETKEQSAPPSSSSVPTPPVPRAVSMPSYPSPNESVEWLSIVGVRDPLLAVVLNAAVTETNTLSIQVANLDAFYFEAARIPGLFPRQAVTLKILDGDKTERFHIVGPALPNLILAERSESQTGDARWRIREEKKRRQDGGGGEALLMLEEEIRSDRGRGGMRRLVSRSIRSAAGGRVSLADARGIEGAQKKGYVFPHDVGSWCRDEELLSLTIPAGTLIEILERDYAGPGRIVTDGVGALVANGVEDIGVGVDTLDTAKAIASSSDPDQTTTTTTILPALASPYRTTPYARGSIFGSSSLNGVDAAIEIVGWRTVIEEIARQAGIAPSRARPTGIRQHEAIVQFLNQRKTLGSLGADILPFSRKRATAMKRKR